MTQETKTNNHTPTPQHTLRGSHIFIFLFFLQTRARSQREMYTHTHTHTHTHSYTHSLSVSHIHIHTHTTAPHCFKTIHTLQMTGPVNKPIPSVVHTEDTALSEESHHSHAQVVYSHTTSVLPLYCQAYSQDHKKRSFIWSPLIELIVKISETSPRSLSSSGLSAWGVQSSGAV